ncbi:uncharacterized protein [Battus philenor]|uniref:uncharacterized protein n=1 Tax=Battus philenor TaxID=42288 RepID=UPI0035D111D0
MDKSDKESCPVSGTLAMVLQISKYHGAAPLHLKPRGDGYIARASKPGPLGTIGVGLVMDLHVFGTHAAIRVKTTSALIVWLSDLGTLFAIAVIGVIQGETRMKKTLKILKGIEKISEDIGYKYKNPRDSLFDKKPTQIKNSLLCVSVIPPATYTKKWIDQLDDDSARDSIRRLSDSYILLYKVVGNFNDDNGLLLLMLLASYIGILIPVVWTVLRFIEILAMIESFHRTHDEMSTTQVLLSKAIYIMTPAGQRMCTELDTFCKQILLYKPSFSPLSICSLQRSQLATIIAGIVTYMIIILQYHLIEECK